MLAILYLLVYCCMIPRPDAYGARHDRSSNTPDISNYCCCCHQLAHPPSTLTSYSACARCFCAVTSSLPYSSSHLCLERGVLGTGTWASHYNGSTNSRTCTMKAAHIAEHAQRVCWFMVGILVCDLQPRTPHPSLESSLEVNGLWLSSHEALDPLWVAQLR
jgi:hypothetical protein